MKTLTVGNDSFLFPENGTNPKENWGEDATEWAEKVTEVLNDLQTTTDIPTTSTALTNNQSSAANILSLVISVSTVQAAEITYSIKRIGSSTLVEAGKIFWTYDGTNVKISQERVGDAGVVITCTDLGQFQYTSSNLAGHVSSTIKFRSTTMAS